MLLLAQQAASLDCWRNAMYMTMLFLFIPLLLQSTDAPLDEVADRIVEQINE